MSEETPDLQRTIEYLSSAEQVSMGDDWYQYAPAEHFWMKRRFEVFCRLAGTPSQSAWAEVGCGHGAVQQQMEATFGIEVDGIDLNEYALKQNRSRTGRLLCYNVFDRLPALHEAYDHLFLFDVLEHMSDDGAFLDATLHLLKPGGTIVVNTPAFMHFYSNYDIAAGHQRRYNFAAIKDLAAQHGLQIPRWTYWGAPLIPLLVMRKIYLGIRRSDHVIRDGFAVGNKFLNRMLEVCSKAEWIPQHLYGTSLMVVLQKPLCTS